MSADAVEVIARASGARHLILGTGRDAPDPREARLEHFPTTTVDALCAEPADDDPLFPPDWEARQAPWERPTPDGRVPARLHERHHRDAQGRDAHPRQRGRVDRVVPPDHPADGAPDRVAPAALAPAGAGGRAVLRARRRRRHPVRPQPQSAGHLRCAARPRVTSMVVVPAGPRPVLERHHARGREARPDAPPSIACARIARRLPDVRPAPGCSGSVHTQLGGHFRLFLSLGCVPAAGTPAGLGGPRRDRPPGLRRDRDRDRERARPSTTTAWARSGGRPRASRCGSPTTARSSSAAERCSGGYWNAPELTAAAFTEDGWYRTGDLGHLDDHGRLILSGRIKDMIVLPNGFNVYPEDIENALRIAGLRESVVVETKPGRIEAIVLDDAHGGARPTLPRPRGCRGQGRQRAAWDRTSGSPAGGSGRRRTSRARTRSRSSATRSATGPRPIPRCRSGTPRKPEAITAGRAAGVAGPTTGPGPRARSSRAPPGSPAPADPRLARDPRVQDRRCADHADDIDRARATTGPGPGRSRGTAPVRAAAWLARSGPASS